MARSPDSTGLALVDDFGELATPTIEDYCAAAAEYIRGASQIGTKKGKAAQIRLSNGLSHATLASLRETGLSLEGAVAGERTVGGGLRSVKADVSEITETDGLKLAVEIKPVHLAVGRAVWNRFGDIRIFAVNLHLKFPFAVVGGILTLPTTERARSGNDDNWKPTTHLIERAIGRFTRAGHAASLPHGHCFSVRHRVGSQPFGSAFHWAVMPGKPRRDVLLNTAQNTLRVRQIINGDVCQSGDHSTADIHSHRGWDYAPPGRHHRTNSGSSPKVGVGHQRHRASQHRTPSGLYRLMFRFPVQNRRPVPNTSIAVGGLLQPTAIRGHAGRSGGMQ